jgi:hypothetical protein
VTIALDETHHGEMIEKLFPAVWDIRENFGIAPSRPGKPLRRVRKRQRERSQGHALPAPNMLIADVFQAGLRWPF